MSEHEHHVSDDELERFAGLLADGVPDPSHNGDGPGPHNGDVDVDLEPVIFETLREFEKRELPPSVSLVGTHRDGTNLLPQFGWVMPWGKAGSGKTSLVVDLLFHAACGIAWLGYEIGRPLRIVAIVNEGVPGALQDKLVQKLERWEHDSEAVRDNVAVYASPWGAFSFRNEALVSHARDFCVDFGADYIALDPLHTFGTSGSGAPDETEAFKHQLRSFGLWDDLGVITSHHANKAGMVSGDWTRHPDTVFHVEKDGKNPATKFTLEKARPADPDELGVPCLLKWAVSSMGYSREALPTPDVFDEKAQIAKLLVELRKAGKPLGKDALVKLVGGTHAHSRTAIEKALHDGSIVDLIPHRERAYQLVIGAVSTQMTVDGDLTVEDEPTVLDGHDVDEPQTRMDRASATVERASTVPDGEELPPDNGSSPSTVDPPVKGGDGDSTVGTGPTTDDDNPFLS